MSSDSDPYNSGGEDGPSKRRKKARLAELHPAPAIADAKTFDHYNPSSYGAFPVPFDKGQRDYLEEYFTNEMYPTTTQRKYIAEQWQVKPRRLKTWFQYARKKERKRRAAAAEAAAVERRRLRLIAEALDVSDENLISLDLPVQAPEPVVAPPLRSSTGSTKHVQYRLLKSEYRDGDAFDDDDDLDDVAEEAPPPAFANSEEEIAAAVKNLIESQQSSSTESILAVPI